MQPNSSLFVADVLRQFDMVSNACDMDIELVLTQDYIVFMNLFHNIVWKDLEPWLFLRESY
jgi:hypothetical protein